MTRRQEHKKNNLRPEKAKQKKQKKVKKSCAILSHLPHPSF